MERVTIGRGDIGVGRRLARAGWYYGGREKEGRRGCLDGGLEMVEMGVLEWWWWLIGVNCARKVCILKSEIKSACFGFLDTFVIA